MAKSLGLEAIRITDPAELKPKLSDAFKCPGAKLIEVVVDGKV
jgi:benzoylformate decarboxylase